MRTQDGARCDSPFPRRRLESRSVPDPGARGKSLPLAQSPERGSRVLASHFRVLPARAGPGGAQYSPRIAAPTSLEGRRSCTRKLIILSDLMSRLQPKKKTPKTTVSDSTQSTAI